MKKRSGNPNSKDQPLRLERVLGITSLHGSALGTNNKGDLFYAAGNISIRYNSDENRQKWFYHSSSRAITCQSVSDDGRYLAIGERGHQPCVTVWDAERKEKLATLNAHKHGIGCLAFSPNGQYLVTVGFKHDRQLIVWEWIHLKIVAVLKLTNKVYGVSFESNGKYFVTCGDRHLKWWYMDIDDEGEVIDIVGKPASILEDHRNAIFMDVCCGSGIYSEHVYCITSTGILCSFLDTSRMMDKWIQLESSSAYCVLFVSIPQMLSGVDVDKIMIIAGCADGMIRAFTPDTLTYLSTFPLPCPITSSQTNNEEFTNYISNGVNIYPACYAIKYIPSSSSSSSSSSLLSNPTTTSFPKLATVYADHTLFIWNISDINNVTKYRSFESHRGCIWDIQFIEPVEDSSPSPQHLPTGTFITCGSDHTIRFWNTDIQAQKKSKWRSLYSREVLHMIDTSYFDDSNMDSNGNSPSSKRSASSTDKSVVGEASILSAGSSSLPSNSRSVVDLTKDIPDYELPDKHHGATAPRAMAIHSQAGHLACGDRSGKLRVYDLRTMKEIMNIQAHSAEILTLHYSPSMQMSSEGIWSVDVGDLNENDKESPLILLASAGRDRLMHIFDASNNYSLIKTLDNHSSSVTTVKFTFDGQRILSCGGDRTLVFCSVVGPEVTRMKSVQTPHGTINGLALETTNKFAITSGQDRRMNIWNVQSGKHMRAYKSDLITGELYKCDIDPSGTYVCACAFDKTIHLLDFFSGDVIAQVSGHSELITGIRFSPDGRYIITIGGDGCIMMWKLGDLFVKAMQDRLMELYSKAQRKESKAILRQSLSLQHNKLSSAITESSNTKSSLESHQGKHGIDKNSKWAVRVSEEDGYELFGKKVIPTEERHKLTLELTETSANAISNTIANVTVPVLSQGQNVFIQSNENNLASTFEDLDRVILSGLSDDEDDDGSRLFPNLDSKLSNGDEKNEKNEDEYSLDENFEPEDVTGNESSFHQTKSKLDSLEKSAQNLENWLEQMLRNEGKLDDTVSITLGSSEEKPSIIISSPSIPLPSVSASAVASISTVPIDSSSNPLNRSISSKFFKNLHNSTPDTLSSVSLPKPTIPIVVDTNKQRQQQQILSPSSSSLQSSQPSIVSTEQKLDSKRRETAAAVAQMKERLRAMGILNATIKPIASDDKDKINDREKNRERYDLPPPPPSMSDIQSSSSLFPPKPPSNPSSPVRKNTLSESIGTNETISDDEEDRRRSDQQRQSISVLRASVLGNLPGSSNVSVILTAADRCRQSLRELDLAKEKAMNSLREFMLLQEQQTIADLPPDQSVNASATNLNHGNIWLDETSSILKESISNETELLVKEYQRSIQSMSIAMSQSLHLHRLPGGKDNTSTVNALSQYLTNTSISSQGDVSGILEKYSDRLLELVSSKIADKMTVNR